MKVTNTYKRVPCAKIQVDRENRQRREIDTELAGSIKKYGVILPVIIDRELNLRAGERRLAGSIAAGIPDIPVRFIEDMSPLEAKLIELEENTRRKDLPWQDNTRAIEELHKLSLASDPEWNQAKTAELLGQGQPWVSINLRVARDLSNPKIFEAPNVRAAHNMLARTDQRLMGTALSEILETGTELFAKPPAPANALKPGEKAPLPPPVPPPPKPESILQEDFLLWAPQYSGPPFNLIHCDFPFGINAFAGTMSARGHSFGKGDTYGDSPDIYWALLRCLCDNLDKLMAHSAHLLFWYSMEHHSETLAFFAKHAPSLAVQKFPLLWHKSDNVGMIPDPKRGPRRVYETCLFASREDRFIIKAVSNVYPAPTDKTLHPSAKPESMLRHFFGMVVDEHTSLLDPTCGSGTSLRAAESLGANRVLGLELDPDHCEAARGALKRFRVLRAASEKIN